MPWRHFTTTWKILHDGSIVQSEVFTELCEFRVYFSCADFAFICHKSCRRLAYTSITMRHNMCMKCGITLNMSCECRSIWSPRFASRKVQCELFWIFFPHYHKSKDLFFLCRHQSKDSRRIIGEFVKRGKECGRILTWTIWWRCTTNTLPVVSGNLVCDESVVWCPWKGGTGSGGDQFLLIPRAGGQVLPHLTNQRVLFVSNVT